MRASQSRPAGRPGFTLVELLVSMAILTFIMLVLVSMTDAARKTWSYTTIKTEEFRGAREAYESITRRLSQATLNTYLDYHYPGDDTTKAPDRYVRQSELRFISSNAQTLTGNTNSPTHAVFYQAPLGYASQSAYTNMDSLLNTWGYFIEYGDDSASRPTFLGTMAVPPPLHYRFRLKELTEPSENMTLYQYTSGTNGTTPKNPNYFTNPSLYGLTAPTGTSNGTGREWFTTPLGLTANSTPPRPVRVLAENIVALVILPKLTPSDEQSLIKSGTVNGTLGTNLAPTYSYDSTAINANQYINPKNQLPPIVQVTMVAVDDASFNRQQPGAVMPDYSSTLFPTNSAGSAAKFQTDLNQLQANLLGKPFSSGGVSYSPNTSHVALNYRVFTTNVSLRSAKWSREQQN